MKNNILLTLISLICIQAGLINAMKRNMFSYPLSTYQDYISFIATRPTQAQLDNELFVIVNKLHIDRDLANWNEDYFSETIDDLIRAGANINAKNKEGKTPISYALEAYKWKGNQTRIEATRQRAYNALIAMLTYVSFTEIQHVIPAIIALTKQPSNLGKDVGSIIAAQLIPEIVNAKLALAKKYLPNVPEAQLRQEIINSINRVIAKSPRMQAPAQ